MKPKSRAFGPVYVGLDVSVMETSIRVLDDEGRTVWEGSVAPEPTVISEAINAVAAYPKRVASVIDRDARHAHRILTMRHPEKAPEVGA